MENIGKDETQLKDTKAEDEEDQGSEFKAECAEREMIEEIKAQDDVEKATEECKDSQEDIKEEGTSNIIQEADSQEESALEEEGCSNVNEEVDSQEEVILEEEETANNMEESDEPAEMEKGEITIDSLETQKESEQSHPYGDVLDKMLEGDFNLKKLPTFKPKPVKKKKFIHVETKALFMEIVEQLTLSKVIGVAVKFSDGYNVRINLIQLSANFCNYLIDPQKLVNCLYILNDIFTDPKIVKVVHFGQRLLKIFQREYKIYFVNIFDTAIAIKYLNKDSEKKLPQHLKPYLEKVYNVTMSEGPKLWYLRPIRENLIADALTEINYFSHMHVTLRNALLERGLLKDFLISCVKMCKKVFNTSVHDTFKVETIFSKLAYMTPGQVHAMYALDAWRHRVGKKSKKNIQKVLSDYLLKKLALELPIKRVEILKICKDITVDARLEAIHNILAEARMVIGPVYDPNDGAQKDIQDPNTHKVTVSAEKESLESDQIANIINESLGEKGIDDSLKAKISAAINMVLNEDKNRPGLKNQANKAKQRPFKNQPFPKSPPAKQKQVLQADLRTKLKRKVKFVGSKSPPGVYNFSPKPTFKKLKHLFRVNNLASQSKNLNKKKLAVNTSIPKKNPSFVNKNATIQSRQAFNEKPARKRVRARRRPRKNINPWNLNENPLQSFIKHRLSPVINQRPWEFTGGPVRDYAKQDRSPIRGIEGPSRQHSFHSRSPPFIPGSSREYDRSPEPGYRGSFRNYNESPERQHRHTFDERDNFRRSRSPRRSYEISSERGQLKRSLSPRGSFHRSPEKGDFRGNYKFSRGYGGSPERDLFEGSYTSHRGHDDSPERKHFKTRPGTSRGRSRSNERNRGFLNRPSSPDLSDQPTSIWEYYRSLPWQNAAFEGLKNLLNMDTNLVAFRNRTIGYRNTSSTAVSHDEEPGPSSSNQPSASFTNSNPQNLSSISYPDYDPSRYNKEGFL